MALIGGGGGWTKHQTLLEYWDAPWPRQWFNVNECLNLWVVVMLMAHKNPNEEFWEMWKITPRWDLLHCYTATSIPELLCPPSSDSLILFIIHWGGQMKEMLVSQVNYQWAPHCPGSPGQEAVAGGGWQGARSPLSGRNVLTRGRPPSDHTRGGDITEAPTRVLWQEPPAERGREIIISTNWIWDGLDLVDFKPISTRGSFHCDDCWRSASWVKNLTKFVKTEILCHGLNARGEGLFSLS